MRNISPFLIVIGSGIATFVLGARVEPNTLNSLTSAVLVSTLLAVLWYTVETRSLRLQQESDSEIRNHPWLKGSTLVVNHTQDEKSGFFGTDSIYLPVTNVGTTPAHALQVNIRWEIKGGLSAHGTKQYNQLVLAPNDTYHLQLCEINFNTPNDRAVIEVDMIYTSFVNGGGHFTLTFLNEPGKGWANGPMSPYEFWLSDGQTFPPKAAT